MGSDPLVDVAVLPQVHHAVDAVDQRNRLTLRRLVAHALASPVAPRLQLHLVPPAAAVLRGLDIAFRIFGFIAVGLVLAYFVLVGGARYLPPALLERFSDLVPYMAGVDITSVEVNDANWAVIERMAHWQAAVGMFSDHPWLGVGIGNYAVAYPRYAVGRWLDPLGHAHNYYLNIAAESGLVGLGAFVLLFAACFHEAWRVLSRLGRRLSGSGSGYWRTVSLGVLGVLVHLSVHNVFDNLFVHSMNVQLALVLGLLAVAGKAAETPHAHRD